MYLFTRMMQDTDAMKEAEHIINGAICSGQYVAIELDNGTVVRLDKPIKIANIDIVDNVNGRWNLNV